MYIQQAKLLQTHSYCFSLRSTGSIRVQVAYLFSSVALRSHTQHTRTTHAHPLATNGDNCSKRVVVDSLRAASSASESLADPKGPQRGTPLKMADTRQETQKAKLIHPATESFIAT